MRLFFLLFLTIISFNNAFAAAPGPDSEFKESESMASRRLLRSDGTMYEEDAAFLRKGCELLAAESPSFATLVGPSIEAMVDNKHVFAGMLEGGRQKFKLLGEPLPGAPTGDPEGTFYASALDRRTGKAVVYRAEKVGDPIPYPSFSAEGPKKTVIVGEEKFAELGEKFPVVWMNPTEPRNLDVVGHLTYYGYAFQEPRVIIESGNDKYIASTNGSGPCMSIGVLNRTNGIRGTYHTNAPVGNFDNFLRLINRVQRDGSLSDLEIKLVTGFAREDSLVAAYALNKMVQMRLDETDRQVPLYVFDKIRFMDDQRFFKSPEGASLDEDKTMFPYAAAVAVLPEGVCVLRDQDTLGKFPRVDPATDPDLFDASGWPSDGVLEERLDSKMPAGVSAAEWVYYKVVSSPIWKHDKTPKDAWSPPVDGITVEVPSSHGNMASIYFPSHALSA